MCRLDVPNQEQRSVCASQDERSTIRYCLSAQTSHLHFGSTILVECVGNGRYSESPRELSRCRRRRHSVEKDGITGRLGLKFIRVEGQVPMSETAYSHAMAQRDVEIANLKREIAELRQVVSQNQGQIMNLMNAHRPILMQLCQRLGISTEIPDLPVK